jgi:hypothetical protein
LAAWPRMSRSVASLICWSTSAAFSVSNAATRPGAQPARPPPNRAGPPAQASVGPAPRLVRTRGSTGPGPGRAPTPAACVGRSQIRGGPSQRGTRGRPVQVNSLAAEVLRVVLAGHDRGSSRFPGRGRIQRVQDQGSRPTRAGAVNAPRWLS